MIAKFINACYNKPINFDGVIMTDDKKIALLIDAENVSAKYIGYICKELTKYGVVTYKRIYGDWTGKGADGWKKVLLEHSITPIQQYSYTVGKNSSDSAMIIDAMDILYSQSVDSFCIVSSDSDFTRLAVRLRENGNTVIGMGEKKTPQAFITACEKFIYLEMLAPVQNVKKTQKRTTAKSAPDNKENLSIESDKTVIIDALKDIIEDLSDDMGLAYLGDVFNVLGKRFPDFDSRLYGFKKASEFIRSLDEFETEARSTKGTGNPDRIFVKIAKKKNKK